MIFSLYPSLISASERLGFLNYSEDLRKQMTLKETQRKLKENSKKID